MSVSYDIFTDAFLNKISEYDFIALDDADRVSTVDGYMKRAISSFKSTCKFDLTSTYNDDLREFDTNISAADIDEIADIISEGMIVQWLKQYKNKQELLENVLNTRDYTTYSPAELLLRVGNAYEKAQKDFTQMMREYSYSHGDLTVLHL